MTDINLHEMVARLTEKDRITFGDVRRLQRDVLPDGIGSREELALLAELDGTVARSDSAWADWLVDAVLELASAQEVSDEPAVDGVGWLERALAPASPKLRRRILRELRRETEAIETPATDACLLAAQSPAAGVMEPPLQMAA
jgi:hypothetical protein